MSSVNIDLAADTILNVMVGQQDENEVREVVFDFSDWYTTYGSGTISLAIQRPKDEWPYEGTLTVDNSTHKATWEISDTDSAYAGVGQIQLSYTVGTAVKKSVVYRFTVYKSLGALGSVITPIQIQTFIDEVTEALEDMQEELNDVKQDLAELQEEIEGGGTGMSEDFKQALHDILEKVAYIDDDGQDYLDALDNAMWPPTPPKTVVSISAVYTQSGTVYDTDTLNSLKSDLVVTATYDDSTSEVVTNYTLSGTLEEGTSTITVSYGGKTTTFTVTVTHNILPLYDWDFTESLVDSVGNVTAVLTGCTRDSSGVKFTSANQAIKLGSDKITITNKTYIIDIPSMTLTDGGTNHARLLCSDTADVQTDTGAAAFVYRHNNGWTVYSGSTWGTSFNKTTYPIDFFNNKRLKIYIGTDLKLKVSYANIGSDEFTNIGTISLAFESTYEDGYLVIGGNRNNNLSPVTISAIKIYEGEV